MSEFSLEIDNWGEWNTEGYFLTLPQAVEFGKEFFAQNVWRVVDRYSDANVFSYDPFYQIELAASAEIARFNSIEEWRMNCDRSQARRQRTRMSDIASRQRGTRTRIRVQRFTRVQLPDDWALQDNYWAIMSPNKEKINWKKDGF